MSVSNFFLNRPMPCFVLLFVAFHPNVTHIPSFSLLSVTISIFPSLIHLFSVKVVIADITGRHAKYPLILAGVLLIFYRQCDEGMYYAILPLPPLFCPRPMSSPYVTSQLPAIPLKT
jgi:hypothetical protein